MTNTYFLARTSILAITIATGLAFQAHAQEANVVIGEATEARPAQEGAPEILSDGATGLEGSARVVDAAQVDFLACVSSAAERIGEEARYSGETACKVTASSRTAVGLRGGAEHLERTAARLNAYSETLARQALEAARSAEERGREVTRLAAEQANLRAELVRARNALPAESEMTAEQRDELGILRDRWDELEGNLEDAQFLVQTDRTLQQRFEIASADMSDGWAAFRDSARTLERSARRHESFVKRTTANAAAAAIYDGLTSEETTAALTAVATAMGVLNGIDDPNLNALAPGSDNEAQPCTFCALPDGDNRAWLDVILTNDSEVN